MVSNSRFDAAGWLFWTVVFALCAGPCMYAAWQIIDPKANRLYPIGTGFVVAAILAGFISWAVNAALQWREKRQRIERRKKARKRK